MSMNKIAEFFEVLWSITIALIRLFFLTCAMVTSGVQIILFTGTEICNLEMKGMPLRHQKKKDMENLAFVDTLLVNNQDLLDYADENSGDLPPLDDSDDDKGCFGD